jgi:hypothetical protein
LQWRSIAEIFQYLGAVLRDNKSDKVTFTVPLENPENNVATAPSGSATTPTSNAQTTALQQNLFVLDTSPNPTFNKPEIFYDGVFYYVPPDSLSSYDRANTMAILSMLNTLVNLANGASSASSEPVRLLPLP